jgi:hypothetical protein
MSQSHKRRSARKRVSQVIMVTNTFSGESLGRIGNLSMEGMMLIAPRDMPEEHYFQVAFALGPGSNNKVEVGIQSLWCDEARTPNTHWVGCKIIDISPDDQLLLNRWVEQATEVVR